MTVHTIVHIHTADTAPVQHCRHSQYQPAQHSITLLAWDVADSVYVQGTPGQLHAFGLAVIAAADEAARLEQLEQAEEAAYNNARAAAIVDNGAPVGEDRHTTGDADVAEFYP